MALQHRSAPSAIHPELSPDGIRRLMHEFIKQALSEALMAFGTGISAELKKLEEKIETSENYKLQLRQAVKSVDLDKGKLRRAESYMDTNFSQGKEVTAESREATSPGAKNATRNAARKYRRKRSLAKQTWQRELLLQARPANSLHEVTADCRAAKGSVELLERISNIEMVVMSRELSEGGFLASGSGGVDASYEMYGSVEWGPWQCAVPATELAKQCAAARLLQRTWRRFSVARRAVAPTSEESEGSNEQEEPLAFLSIADIGKLAAVSYQHASVLWELGFVPAPPASEWPENAEEGEEDERWSSDDTSGSE